MIPQKNINHHHTARYLVLLDQDDARRALLFAQDDRFLGEVIDDDNGLVLDNLMRAGNLCPPPRRVAEYARAANAASLLCFALDEEEAEAA
ncbi:MAG TPA: hypothetical protein VGD46_10570 [Rhizobacter sp.]